MSERVKFFIWRFIIHGVTWLSICFSIYRKNGLYNECALFLVCQSVRLCVSRYGVLGGLERLHYFVVGFYTTFVLGTSRRYRDIRERAAEVGVYKRKQESKKRKKTYSRPRKKGKTFFLIVIGSSRILLSWSRACLLSFLLSCFLW